MAGQFSARVLASSNVPGRGTVAVVEVRSGSATVGTRLLVGEESLHAEVTAVETFAQDEEDREAGALPQVGLLLTGVDRSDVPRGSQIALEVSND